MPKSCKECNLTYLDSGDDAYFGSAERRCVIDGSCIDGTSERAYDCPLKSTDEMIAEIKEKSFVDYDEAYTNNGKCLITEDDVLEIINKYCK